MSREKSRSPTVALWLRAWVQTTNIVEPGRYSQRSTALPRSERKLKLGSLNVNGCAGPPASGSTVYVPPASPIVPRSTP